MDGTACTYVDEAVLCMSPMIGGAGVRPSGSHSANNPPPPPLAHPISESQGNKVLSLRVTRFQSPHTELISELQAIVGVSKRNYTIIVDMKSSLKRMSVFG